MSKNDIVYNSQLFSLPLFSSMCNINLTSTTWVPPLIMNVLWCIHFHNDLSRENSHIGSQYEVKCCTTFSRRVISCQPKMHAALEYSIMTMSLPICSSHDFFFKRCLVYGWLSIHVVTNNFLTKLIYHFNTKTVGPRRRGAQLEGLFYELNNSHGRCRPRRTSQLSTGVWVRCPKSQVGFNRWVPSSATLNGCVPRSCRSIPMTIVALAPDNFHIRVVNPDTV